jgi:ATP-dependent Clp protease, protease subunit
MTAQFDADATRRRVESAFFPPSQSVIVPAVTEKTSYGIERSDIYSRLLKERIIFIGTPIDDTVANLTIAQLLFLQSEDSSKDIAIYLNTPGGSVYGGLAIYDTMQHMRCDVATFCTGMAMSMGAILLCGGTKGKRFALPHSTVLIHQPWSQGGGGGQATDIEIAAKEILRQRDELYAIIAKHTGQPLDRIKKDADRDFFMSAEDAHEYGIVDEVLTSAK